MKKLFLTLSLSILFIPFGISQDLPSYVPTDGLVAYYPFNGNANDESGNGNHGTVNGATLTSDRDGNENSSYNFDGVDDYIFLGKNSDFPISNSFSISIFFLIQDVNCKNDTNDSCDNIIYNNEGLFELGINKINSKLKFSINNSEPDWGWIDIEFDYDFEKWIHLIFNYDDGLIKIFINNSNVYSYNGVGDIINDIHQDLDEFRLGNRQLGDVSNGNHFFTGKIDDFGIWNRALTEQEIQDVYTSSNGDIILDGVVSAENNQIKNVADPTEAQDAVTKSYTETKFYTQSEVDALIANIQQQINEMNQTITSSELEGNWNVKELYYLNPDTNEITSTFPTPECSKPYQYYEFLQNNGLSKTGIGTNWATQQCTSTPYPETQVQYTISIVDDYTYISWPRDEVSNNELQVLERVSADTMIVRYWRDGEISLYNNQVYGFKLVKEARIE